MGGSSNNAPENQQSSDSGAENPSSALAHVTDSLQYAVSGQDKGTSAQELIASVQHLPVLPDQRHVPSAVGLQLLQLGSQALTLAAGHVQVIMFAL